MKGICELSCLNQNISNGKYKKRIHFWFSTKIKKFDSNWRNGSSKMKKLSGWFYQETNSSKVCLGIENLFLEWNHSFSILNGHLFACENSSACSKWKFNSQTNDECVL
jgi:hypothetical protein